MKKNIAKGMIFTALFSFSFLSFSQTSAYAAEADASEAKNMLKNIVSKYSDMEEDAVSEHSNEYKVSTLIKLRATTDKTLEDPSAAQETSPETTSKEDNEDIKNADAAEKSVSVDKKEEEEKTSETEAGAEMPVIENAEIPETETAASTATPTITVVKLAEKEIEIYIHGLKPDCPVTKETLEIKGIYTDSHGDTVHVLEIKKIKHLGENHFLITSTNKLLKTFAYSAIYKPQADGPSYYSGMFGLSQEPQQPSEEAMAKPTLQLNNQEAIRITDNATMPDGSRPQNMRDIAALAFSFQTSDGIMVIPTYDDDTTGVAEIASVKYRTNKRAKAVIVESVFFKVYLDANLDGKVTREEKTDKAIGYYYVEVKIDKTLTVEDWDIVTP